MVVLEAESAEGWESILSGCFVPLRFTGLKDTFTGRMEHTAIDDCLSVSYVTTSGDIADRTERLAARADSDDIHVTLQRASSGTVSQCGRATAVRPGSVTVYATDRPYYLDYSRCGQRQLVIQVSRSSLPLPEKTMEAAMWRINVPGGVEVTATRNLFSYLARPLLSDRLESEANDPADVAATTRDLMATMLRASFGEGSTVPRTSSGLRYAVQEYLRSNATTRGIDMDQVARIHFVSRRRLYQVFEQAGISPARFLRQERLRAATELLSQRDGEARTIEQIAYGTGFDDRRTFERAFRRSYECSPSEWRAAALAG
ncbi:MAG: helix-turn-helix domain-containing protein [Schumannella sp.]